MFGSVGGINMRGRCMVAFYATYDEGCLASIGACSPN